MRDTISQGVPFMCSKAVQTRLVDPLLSMTPLPNTESSTGEAMCKVTASLLDVGSCDVCLQFFHNAQIKMQADHSLDYPRAVSTIWREHGAKVLWMEALRAWRCSYW